MKKVSVIIPAHKVEKYIAATVQSVLEQTYKHFELLIIDDGSPDRTIEICQQFKDSRIKIIRQSNRGAAGARNTGIHHAQGEYLAFLDGDDLWLPEKLERHVEHLGNSPAVGVSFSRSAFINEAGISLGTYLMPKLKEITVLYLLRGNPIGNGSAPVIRRAVFEAIKFQSNLYGTVEDYYFDEQFQRSEDIECWLRIAVQTPWQIEGIPEPLTLYRVNPGGLSANFLKQFESWEQVIEKIRSYAPELITQWGDLGRAYRLRYLGRSAVRMKAGPIAVELLHRALATYWRILLEEPRCTLMTLISAYLLLILPQALYSQIEALALRIAGVIQRRCILQNQSRPSL